MVEQREKISAGVEIRYATIDDIPNIEAGIRASWAMHAENEPQLFDIERLNASSVEEYYRQALASENSAVFVAEKDGQFAGFIKTDVDTIPPWYRHKEILYLDDIYVGEAFRRKGIGDVLIDRAEKEARERGIKRVQGRVYAFNKPIQELLRRRGYDFPHMTANKVLE